MVVPDRPFYPQPRGSGRTCTSADQSKGCATKFELLRGPLAPTLHFLKVVRVWQANREAVDTSVTNVAAMQSSWEAPGMLPGAEPARVARYRRLQSWYRAVQLDAPAGKFMSYEALGSWLHEGAVKKQRDLNFLHPSAFDHAEARKDEVRVEGGSLDPKRLFHNMLSSMPLCFNLFGAMRSEPDFLAVFQDLFDKEATSISEIICEWAPPDGDARLGDRTAFDAVVFYEVDGGTRFLGVETKYTESFSPKEYAANESNRYAEVTRDSGWFADPERALLTLKGTKSNQLWRNVMLASQLEQHGSRGDGSVAVVALRNDAAAGKAMEIVGPALSPERQDRLRSVAIEDILDAVDVHAPSLGWWASSFRRRYVDFRLPDDPAASRDPLGPIAGRSISATAGAARAAQAASASGND